MVMFFFYLGVIYYQKPKINMSRIIYNCSHIIFQTPTIKKWIDYISGSRNRKNGDISGSRNRKNGAISGSRNHQNGAISGSINRQNGWQILYGGQDQSTFWSFVCLSVCGFLTSLLLVSTNQDRFWLIKTELSVHSVLKCLKVS